MILSFINDRQIDRHIDSWVDRYRYVTMAWKEFIPLASFDIFNLGGPDVYTLLETCSFTTRKKNTHIKKTKYNNIIDR